MERQEIRCIEDECGVVATLVKHPEFIFYTENLLPSHFTDRQNRAVFVAIQNLAQQGISRIDAFNILSSLESMEGTRSYREELTIEGLQEMIEMSDVLGRDTPEEYKMVANNVIDAAMRRDILRRLKECEKLCYDRGEEGIEEKIYRELDDVMVEYSSTDDIPAYSDVVDDCWAEIQHRQHDGYAGIPFPFETLNKFATIERGELFVFAAEQKQGKSMMLLTCLVDLLRKDQAVLYLDSELNTRLFTARMLAHLTQIEFSRINSGNYSIEESKKISEAIDWLKTRKLTHIYIPMFDVQTIYTSVKRVSHTQGLDVLIVDYLKGSSSGDAYESYAELGRFADLIKNKIAGQMNVAAIAAAQATSTGKVADSAKIARSASTVAFITEKTSEEMQTDGPQCGNKKLRIAFNRNGPQHSDGDYIDLRFLGNFCRYEEAEQHVPTSPY